MRQMTQNQSFLGQLLYGVPSVVRTGQNGMVTEAQCVATAVEVGRAGLVRGFVIGGGLATLITYFMWKRK